MAEIQIAKETVYLDADGKTTTDPEKAAELFIFKGQELTAVHIEAGVKGIEPAEENKSELPETENKSGKKSK